MWKIRGFGWNTTSHSSGWTTIQSEYLPLARACPLTVTSWLTSTVAAQLAPGVQTSPQWTTPPKMGSRPRTEGREATTVMVAPSTVWTTLPSSLART